MKNVLAVATMCLCAGNLPAATINVDTSSIQGQHGFLDFQFSGPGLPMATLSVSGLNLGGGTVNNESLTGEATGSLTSQLNMLNTLNFPPNEDFAGVTFGKLLSLQFFFSGPAVTNPDGVSGPSTFAFSILDSTGTAPLLLQPDWATVDPGGFGALIDLNHFGGGVANSFLATGTVNAEPVSAPPPIPAPEPAPMGLIAAGLGLILVSRLRRGPLARLALVATGCVTGIFAQDWAPGPAAGPGFRQQPSMAYDAARKQAVLFGGGSNGAYLNDMWVWDGAAWTQKFPLHNPPGRSSAAMAYDAARGQIVLFGGVSNGVRINDTWLWDGADWHQAATPLSPPARFRMSMTYDAARARVVLFGGEGDNGILGDTWTWNGTTWAQQMPATHPSARAGASLGFDANTGQVILFGGSINTFGMADTWAWNGTAWSALAPAHSPAARYSAATTTGPVTISGGSGSVAGVADVWAWSGSDWVQRPTPHSPPPSSDVVGSWDARGQLIMYIAGNATSWVYSNAAVPLTLQTQVTASTLVYSRVTGTYVGTITITNTGTTPIQGPLNVLLTNLAPQLRPVNATGVNVAGAPYLAVPGFDTISAQLGPGQSVTVQVQFPLMAFQPVAYQGLWQ